jgi:hypothetical protein
VGLKEEVEGEDEDGASPREARRSLVAEARGGGSSVFCQSYFLFSREWLPTSARGTRSRERSSCSYPLLQYLPGRIETLKPRRSHDCFSSVRVLVLQKECRLLNHRAIFLVPLKCFSEPTSSQKIFRPPLNFNITRRHTIDPKWSGNSSIMSRSYCGKLISRPMPGTTTTETRR